MRHLSVGHAEPLRSELLAFLRAIRSGAAPAVTGEEAVASLEIATRCLAARPIAVAPAQRKGPRAVVG
jgi:predicted dehydrogenase